MNLWQKVKGNHDAMRGCVPLKERDIGLRCWGDIVAILKDLSSNREDQGGSDFADDAWRFLA